LTIAELRTENHTIKNKQNSKLTESSQAVSATSVQTEISPLKAIPHEELFHILLYTEFFFASQRMGPANQQRYFIWEKAAHVLMMTFAYCLTLIFTLWKTGWGSEGISVW
jgi:hypothetical protein